MAVDTSPSPTLIASLRELCGAPLALVRRELSGDLPPWERERGEQDACEPTLATPAPSPIRYLHLPK